MTTSTKQYTIATVAKVTAGVAWFERMRVGVERFGKERGHHTFLIGPPKADSDLQIQLKGYWQWIYFQHGQINSKTKVWSVLVNLLIYL